MARFYLLSFLLLLALTAVAMISCLSAEAGTIRTLPRGVWAVVILLIPLVGPVLYFVFGRPRHDEGTGPAQSPRSRPLAPDDDPDFLRRLGRGHQPPGSPRGQTKPRQGGDDSNNGRSGGGAAADDTGPDDAKDDGRPRGDARTKDDQPPSDGGL